MCGIVGYIGNKNAFQILIKGLQRLEYRGYDSTGIAILDDKNEIIIKKKKGKVKDLLDICNVPDLVSNIGIGHTRWATHGEPNDVNAHPHLSQNSDLAIIHNGIIENYSSIKEALTKEGHHFKSETDTEILIHLIEEIKNKESLDIEEALRVALKRIIGAYAIVILDKNNPDKLYAARKGSPLVLGIGSEGDYFVASDASPIIEYTKDVVYLEEEHILTICKNGDIVIKNIENEIQTPFIQKLDLELGNIEKGGYPHFMIKEIFQQNKTIEDALRGRINSKTEFAQLGGLLKCQNKILESNRVIIVGCGTSWISGLIGEYLLEDLSRIQTEVEYASEFRYRNPIVTGKDVVIAISQSGETADTIAAIEIAKSRGAFVFGICNVVGSSISRLTDSGSYIHAGPEIGVASTKAFTGQIAILTLMALQLGWVKKTISKEFYLKMITEMEELPKKIEKILSDSSKIELIAKVFKDSNNCLYLGRGYTFPVALEGALKLKEISYIHAEGYPAAEMKHGPIALIDENMPVVIIATNLSNREKIISNIQEVKARKGIIFSIIKEGDEEIKKMSDYHFELPNTEDALFPILSVIPLQLLSYYIAVERGCNVDQPRNLAKSVTVE